LLFVSLTCLQWYIRWEPFVFRAQPLDVNPLSHCQHTSKHCFLKSLGVPSLFEVPATFLGGFSWTGRQCFHTFVAWTQHLQLIRRSSKQVLVDLLIWMRDMPLLVHWKASLSCTKEHIEGLKPIGSPPLVRLIKTQLW
jgi:hypothetical protein